MLPMIEIFQKQMQSVAWQAKSIPYDLKSFFFYYKIEKKTVTIQNISWDIWFEIWEKLLL